MFWYITDMSRHRQSLQLKGKCKARRGQALLIPFVRLILCGALFSAILFTLSSRIFPIVSLYLRSEARENICNGAHEEQTHK
jgi:hypothetical protein